MTYNCQCQHHWTIRTEIIKRFLGEYLIPPLILGEEEISLLITFDVVRVTCGTPGALPREAVKGSALSPILKIVDPPLEPTCTNPLVESGPTLGANPLDNRPLRLVILDLAIEEALSCPWVIIREILLTAA